jgi:hypothetical protein
LQTLSEFQQSAELERVIVLPRRLKSPIHAGD